MELYRFSLTPSNRKALLNFLEIENQHHLFTTAAHNCTYGVSFKRDGKQIVIDNITEQTIDLTLFSVAPLTAPNRTLSAFSRELLRLDKHKDLLSSAIYNHTLFKTEILPNYLNENIITLEQVSDSEMLKSLVDLIFSTNLQIPPEQRTDAINAIKQIMLPFINS